MTYLRGVVNLFFVEIFIKLRGFLLVLFLTRTLSPEQYGIWSQFAVIVATALPLTVLGTDSSITYYISGLKADRQKPVLSGWLLCLSFFCLCLGLSMFCFEKQIALLFFGQPNLVSMIRTASLAIFPGTMLVALRTWFRIDNNVRLLSVLNIYQAVVSLLAIVATWFVWPTQVEAIIIASVCADLLLVSYFFIYLLKRGQFAAPHIPYQLKLLKFGIPLLPGAYAVWGLNYLDRLVLTSHHAGLAQIATYSVAYSIAVMIFDTISSPAWRMYAPLAAKHKNQNDPIALQELFNKSAGLVLYLSLPTAAVLYTLAPTLLEIIAGQKYKEGALILPIVFLGYLANFLASYFQHNLVISGKPSLQTTLLLLGLVFNGISNLILISKWGIYGAAWATTIAFVLELIFSFWVAQRFGPRLRINLKFVSIAVFNSLTVLAALTLVSQLFSLNRYLLFAVMLATAGVVFLALSFPTLSKRYPLRSFRLLKE